MFEVGRIMITPDAMTAIKVDGRLAMSFVERHRKKDWPDLEPEELEYNEFALLSDQPIWSIYYLQTGQYLKIWTKGDRSETWLELLQ